MNSKAEKRESAGLSYSVSKYTTHWWCFLVSSLTLSVQNHTYLKGLFILKYVQEVWSCVNNSLKQCFSYRQQIPSEKDQNQQRVSRSLQYFDLLSVALSSTHWFLLKTWILKQQLTGIKLNFLKRLSHFLKQQLMVVFSYSTE